jgi:aminodeoxyfutalosine deaminase
MFGTTLNREYAVTGRLLGLDEDGLADLARTAVRASFAPEDVRTRVLGEIEAYREGAGEK